MEIVWQTLGIDRLNMCDKLVVFEEQHDTNANFLIISVLLQALKKQEAVCFVISHNTVAHYHKIFMQYGYNFLELIKKNQITIVNLMKCLYNTVQELSQKKTIDENNFMIPYISQEYTFSIYKYYKQIKKEFEKALKFNKSAVLIIEDLSQLLNLNFDVCDTMLFVRYIQTLVSNNKSQLFILVHSYQEHTNTNTNLIVNGLKHMAHLHVTTEPLKTGHSSIASGKLIVHWKLDQIRMNFHWPEKATYLFKLSGSCVKIFEPGAESIL